MFHGSLDLNTLFHRFWGILTSKYMNRIYVDAVQTLNKQPHPTSYFMTTKMVTFTLHAVVWLSKTLTVPLF